MDPRGEEDINKTNDADSEDHKLVLRIFAEGLEKTITRGAVAGAAVGLKDR